MMRAWIAALCVLAISSVAAAGEVERSPVEVERIEPKRTKHPTLGFLKQNVDFLRARLDWLVEVPRSLEDEAGELDARWLRYREMMAESAAARDSVAAARLAQERLRMLESVSDLAALEARLDEIDGLLDAQATRLAWLDEDFTGRQETALIVVATSLPDGAAPDAIRLVDEDGHTRRVSITADHVETLRAGGIAQILHDFVEPREQVWEVSLSGAGWADDIPVYMTLHPDRDRLSVLELDLARLRPSGGAVGLEATIWVHYARSDADDWRWASR